jgi:hypothetical protein
MVPVAASSIGTIDYNTGRGMTLLPEVDEADRRHVTLRLAAVLIALGLLGFGSFWIKWRDGVQFAVTLAIILIPGALQRPRSAEVEERSAAYWRGVRRVILIGFAVMMAWVAFQLYQGSL